MALERVLAVAAFACSLAGCYDPRLRDCTVQCASQRECAGGQVCGADGLCAMPAVAGHCMAVLDDAGLPPPRDATMLPGDAPPDADRCPSACTKGTCDDGVCVIDCSAAGTCLTDVQCPQGVPCRVVCGDHSCTHHVICPSYQACDVECTGQYACGDVIQCGYAACNVACSGYAACHKHTACPNACSCDVECTGATSCPEVSQCPLGPACTVGHGCTSTLPGCDRC